MTHMGNATAPNPERGRSDSNATERRIARQRTTKRECAAQRAPGEGTSTTSVQRSDVRSDEGNACARCKPM